MLKRIKLIIFQFLTALISFVIVDISFAAPVTDIPPSSIKTSPKPSENREMKESIDLKESTNITPTAPPPISTTDESPIISSRQLAKEATTFTVGYWLGSLTSTEGVDRSLYAKLGKSFYNSSRWGHEYTLDVTTAGQLGWSAGLKRMFEIGCCYEPYFKLSAGALYVPSENFATFINWKRYQIRGEIGFEDLFKWNRTARAELGLVWSGFGFSTYLGFSNAF